MFHALMPRGNHYIILYAPLSPPLLSLGLDDPLGLSPLEIFFSSFRADDHIELHIHSGTEKKYPDMTNHGRNVPVHRRDATKHCRDGIEHRKDTLLKVSF